MTDKPKSTGLGLRDPRVIEQGSLRHKPGEGQGGRGQGGHEQRGRILLDPSVRPPPEEDHDMVPMPASAGAASAEPPRQAANDEVPAAPAARPDAQPAPQPATRTASGAAETTLTSRAKALADTVIESFIDRLRAAADERGGFLTTEELDKLNAEFREKSEALQKVFQLSMEDYVRARERAAFDHARQFPFDRILVNTFARLFQSDHADPADPHRLSRRVLPGFLLAADKMLGEERSEALQARAREVVERLAPNGETELNWQRVYDDPAAKLLALDALITFAPYFEDLPKRRDWFCDLVNGNLTPAAENSGPDAEWYLTATGFERLVDALFGELKLALANGATRKALAQRHSEAACVDAERALERIEALRGR
jgi:hypothetical protein